MVVHYFTLSALCCELDTALRGAPLNEIFSQQKNELVLATADGRALVVSVEPRMNYCFLRDAVARARRNSVDLFPDLTGKVIRQISLHPSDRIVKISFSNERQLLLQLYNSSTSNLLLIDEANVIRDAFKNGTDLIGSSHQPDDRVIVGERIAEHLERLPDVKSGSILAGLKKALPVLGTIYCREVLFRAGVEENAAPSSLGHDQLRRISEECGKLFGETQRPEASIYTIGAEAHLSVVPLNHLADTPRKLFPTVNDAVRSFISNSFRSTGLATGKTEFLPKLKSECEKLARSVAMMQKEAEEADRAEGYEQIGNILLAHLPELKKGMEAVTLPDMYHDDAPIRIALDRSKNPAQNAERYFDKARNARAAREENIGRLRLSLQRRALVERMILELDSAESQQEVKEFITTYREQLKEMKLMHEKPGEELPPFRMFTVAGGYEVWVGKSSANNDLLTMKYAKQNDLWFHVRGASGSHTVLKVKSRTPTPREAVRQAAAIAAYYSKMRKAGSVPVAYCERKYVRKPRGLREGAVTLEREEVVFVKPALP